MEIFGRDLPNLFVNACYAMFDNILDLSTISPAESRRIELRSATREELFLDWLRELLFRFSNEYFVAKEVTKIELVREQGAGGGGQGGRDDCRLQNTDCRMQNGEHGSWSLAAEVRGEKFDPERHRVKIEIKTPTYHMLSITEEADGHRATVVFDV
jgi:SHS2 domain-containing protein